MVRMTIEDDERLEQAGEVVLDALTAAVQRVVDHHRLLKTGQRKLVAIIDNGEVRKVIVELAMSPAAFEAAGQ
jgi:hypothetical protein